MGQGNLGTVKPAASVPTGHTDTIKLVRRRKLAWLWSSYYKLEPLLLLLPIVFSGELRRKKVKKMQCTIIKSVKQNPSQCGAVTFGY